jgi:transposase
MGDGELAEVTVPGIWAGVDIGKEHHHCVVINADGERLLSRRVLNDETELLQLLGDVLAISTDVLWAVDLNHGGAALLIGLLLSHDQPIAYLTGLAVHRASATYKGGEGKTDAKDAFVIADQARVRRDLGLLRPGDEIAVDLRTLTNRRLDVVFDRTRQINRLRAQLLEIFPALERSLDLVNKGPILLLTGYQTPAAIRRAGARRIETWLKHRKARGAAALAKKAVKAAQAQQTALPGEKLAAAMVARLAKGVMALDEEIAELDTLIEARFREHPHAGVIRSLPGMGPKLGAEFIAATGGDMDAFGSADRLAGFAGLAPRPRDSGRVSGNLHRPKRYHRGLLRTMYLSAMVSTATCPASKAYYQRKRSEGKGHKQALLALARRRLNVLWAMIRDGQCYQATPPITAAA